MVKERYISKLQVICKLRRSEVYWVNRSHVAIENKEGTCCVGRTMVLFVSINC